MERLKIKKYRRTEVPYMHGADDRCWENVIKMKIPPGDIFYNWSSGERGDKCNEDDQQTYTMYHILVTEYLEDENDSEYFARMKKEEDLRKFNESQEAQREDKERLLFLRLKAKYGEE